FYLSNKNNHHRLIGTRYWEPIYASWLSDRFSFNILTLATKRNTFDMTGDDPIMDTSRKGSKCIIASYLSSIQPSPKMWSAKYASIYNKTIEARALNSCLYNLLRLNKTFIRFIRTDQVYHYS